MQYTIESDDDIPLEVEDETDTEAFESDNLSGDKKPKRKSNFKKDHDKKSQFIRFEIDDDDYGSSRDKNLFKITQKQTLVKEDTGPRFLHDLNDNIRLMPRAEERAQRAEIKAETSRERKKKSLQEEKESQSQSQEMDPNDEKAFFDTVLDESAVEKDIMFSQLNLSRALLRGVTAAGYSTPTPIQSQVIPLALAGRDICASAVTGSGKTAAFVLPFLERLIYRPKDVAAIRVLVITPTRELATQIHNVLEKLAKYTDVTFALICGGKKDIKSQEVMLRNRPDIVICTPGRFLDHLRNSQSVDIEALDVLVLDEVDRLLELGFQEDIEELLRYCPMKRQTLLFSATMTPKVEDLVKLSLVKPIRVKVNNNSTQVAPRLIQEFVKVRNEDEREAMLLSVLSRDFGIRTIVFFELKKEAHWFHSLLKLSGFKSCELHGDINQTNRYLALQQFTEGIVDIMVATDVAARGLDIQGVRTVINSEMPRSVSTYIHRVGRTARAGCGGRAITFVSDGRRKIMKDVLKGEGCSLSNNGGQILSRAIPQTVITHFIGKIGSLESDLRKLFDEEKNANRMYAVTSQLEKTENLIIHQDEIKSRPARTWHQTETQKNEIKLASRDLIKSEENKKRKLEEEINPVHDYKDEFQVDDKDRTHRLSRKKRRKLEALKDTKESSAADSVPSKSVSHKEKQPPVQKYEEGLISTIGLHHNKKVSRPKFAVGGIDQDLLFEASKDKVSKRVLKQLAKEKDFSEFDPNKRLKKGGKLGNKSFKSKSKFKRRK